jgi:ankyrin repeat protein
MGDDLIEASWVGDVGKMRKLIESGADVNFHITAHPSCIPLTCAAQQGHIDAVQLLIDNKVDVNATDHSRKTASQWAKEQNHNEIVGLLRQARARE